MTAALRRRFRPLVVVVGLCAGMIAGLVPSAATADAGAEAGFIEKANQERAERGASALRTDSELTAVARRWSARMAQAQSLSHNPNLTSEVTQDWEKLAENVGVGPNVEEVHAAFMGSSSHRSKILDPVFTAVGVGVVTDDKGRMWVTEVFMRLRSGSGGAPPPTTAAPGPSPAAPSSAAAAPAPSASAAPVTTTRPRVRAPRPAPAPAVAPAAPAPPPPVASAGSADAPAVPEPRPAVLPSARLMMVLEGLRSLDQGG